MSWFKYRSFRSASNKSLKRQMNDCDGYVFPIDVITEVLSETTISDRNVKLTLETSSSTRLDHTTEEVERVVKKES